MLCSIAINGSTHLYISGGTTSSETLSRANTYRLSMARSWRQGLGFNIGMSFMQSSLAKEDVISIAFPFAHIDYKIKLNRLPFKLFLGAGFALNHIPTSLGSHYVSTHLIAGLIYKISPYALLKFNYTFNNGETLTGPYSFNGDTISIGVGFNLKKIKNNRFKGVHKRNP